MTTLNQLEDALIKADRAGDYQAANLFADMIRSKDYEDATSISGLLSETAVAVPRGFLQGGLSVGEGLAGLANTITDNVGLEDLIDSGEENELIRLANQGKKAVDETMGVGDAYRDKWLVKAGEGLGSIGTFLAAGVVGGLPAAVAAGVGFGTSDQMARVEAARARGVDVSKEQEDAANAWGGVIGSLEAFVPVKIMKQMKFVGDPSKAKEFLEKITDAAVSGVTEGSQEVINSLLQDAVQTKLVAYDPEGEVSDGESLWDDFTIGGASGAALDLISNAFVKKQRTSLTKEAELEREQQFREEEEIQAENLLNQAEARRIEIERSRQEAEQKLIDDQQAALTEEARIALQEQRDAALEAQYPFDPMMPYSRQVSFQGTRLTPSQKMALEAKDYANQIAQAATRSAKGFPQRGRFDLVEESTADGPVFKVTHSDSGQQYGQSYMDRESAIHLMSNLNDQILRRNVNRTITDSIDETQFQYSPDQVKSVYSIGQRLNNPNRDTVTVTMLNEAGGTIGKGYQENLSIDSLHQIQYGVPPFTDKGEKIYKDLSNLTVAQQINFERVKKGLPETNEFSLKEAKEALGDKYNNVFDLLLGVRSPEADTGPVSDFGSVGAKLAASREAYQSDKQTRQELEGILEAKNITSDINSPEIKYVFDKIVNETNIDNMSPSQRAYLSNQISALPTLPEPGPIPDFTPNPYTLEQYTGALDKVRMTGDGTVENIQEVLDDVESDKRKALVASSIRQRLLDRGVINEDNTLVEPKMLPPPVEEQVETRTAEMRPYAETDPVSFPAFTGIPDTTVFENNFKSALEKIGLGDVGLRVLSRLRFADIDKDGQLIYEEGAATGIAPGVMGYYHKNLKSIFLGVDRAAAILKSRNQEISAESLEATMSEIIDHEIVHAVRGLDLWTKKEWQSLEKLAKEKVFPDTGNETFFDNAKRRYPNLPPVSQMEEAIAELIRIGRQDRSLITGKPKSLIRKMFSFFESLANAVRGSGFNTLDQIFESTLSKLESGEIGSRQRGQIRTLRATETKQMAVPERGIGREIDVVDPETGSQAMTTSGIQAMATDEERIFSDLPLNARREGLSQAFLEENGYVSYDPELMLDDRPDADHYVSEADGSVVAYNYQGKDASGKASFSRKTFRNPTLKSLINWMDGGGRGRKPAALTFQQISENYSSGLLTDAEFAKAVKDLTDSQKPVSKGVNVATDGETNYADLIVSGQKQYETRDTDSLRPYVGKRIGIVETKKGEKAKLVGYATVGEPFTANESQFDDMRDLHLVPEGSKFDIKQGKQKYLYEMINPERLNQPIDVSSTQGIVARDITKAIADSNAEVSAENIIDLPDIQAYQDETLALQEIAARNPEGSPLKRYDETNAKVQDDLAAQLESDKKPFAFQTPNQKYGRLKKLTYQVADKFIGLKVVEDSINKGREALNLPRLSVLDSAYAGEQSIAGKAGNELRVFNKEKKEPLAQKIADYGMTREQVDEFLTLRHAIERNNRIALRDPSQDPESQPGSGSLATGEVLTNSFVEARMRNVYNMTWNADTQTWTGGNSQAKKLLDIAKDTDQIVNDTLDRSVQGELLSREAAESIRSIFKYYTPLQGKHVEDELADAINGISGKSYSVKGKEVMGATGRRSASYSTLGTIITNAEKNISRSLNNTEFGHKLVKLINDYPKSEYWEVYSPDNPKYKKVFDRKYRYVGPDLAMAGEIFSTIPKGMDKKDFVETIGLAPDMDTGDLIGVKINGVQHFIDIKQDDRLREALIASDSNSSNRLVQFLGKVNRFLSMVNTQLNPEFIIGNFSRDIQTAILNIVGEQDMPGGKAKNQALVKKVLKDVMPSMGVFYKAIRGRNLKDGTIISDLTGLDSRDSADVREFLEAGAKADWYYTRPPEEQAKTIDNMINMVNGSFVGGMKRRMNTVLDFVEDANSAVENAVRLATFKASRDSLLESGVGREEAVARAADLAKNLTINFNRKGMSGDLLNSIYLFFNASVQGTMNFGRGLFGPNLNPFSPEASRRKQGMVASLTLFSALLADMAEEESEINPETGRSFYSEIPDYIKERNLVIMADPSTKEGTNLSNTYVGKDGKEYAGSQYYYMIPLPYGYNVFAYLGQALSDIGRGNLSVPQVASNLTSAMMGSFSPVGISPVPTITQPFVELYQNKNFFGSPIYKDPEMYGGTGPYSALSMKSTWEPFKAAASYANALGVPGVIKGGNQYEKGTLDFSPDALEHLFEFAGGGAGKFATRTLKYMGKVVDGDDIELKETPFVRRVYGETDTRESQEDYYDRIGLLKNKKNALNNLTGPERINYRKDNLDYVKMLGLMDTTEKQLRKLRKTRRELEKRASLRPSTAIQFSDYEEKSYEIEKKLYNRFNKQYDKIVGRAN